MRRTKLLSVLGWLPTLGFAMSCESFLDPNPSDRLAPENFYKTPADAVAAVNGVYEQVKWSYWLGFWYVSDVATDDIVAGPRFGSDGHRMSDYIFDATEWPMGDMWGGAYRIINRANAVLDRVPAIPMDPTLRERLLGEARLHRALAYFNLVRCFGDVPLLEHEVKSLVGLNVPRTPAAQVYTLIVSDLQQAAAGLPASHSGADVGRVTSGTAQALLAKVYLTQSDWTNAARAAGQVITSGRYTLLPNWKDNFRIAMELTNSESIFEINYDGVLDPGAGSVHTLFSIPSGYPGGDAYGLMYIPPSLQSLYAAADERGNNGTFMTSPHTDELGRVVTWTDPPGPAFSKYLDETDVQNMNARAWVRQANNWIVLRYADVLLMYAEAVNEGGPATAGTAEAALNLVRVRAGIAPVSGLSQAVFRDSLRLERRREFVFEGQRWFDLSRWGLLDTAIRAKLAELGKPVRGVPSSLLPIPQAELDINPNLTQNLGW
jgi:starch-binding outer membrane protein, SusD/RagB family